ncbi:MULTISPECIES: EAL and HDOD domain-containing protein [Halomonadaceae]|nr:MULTISPECIES: HDOD domain-containing protein [unclassified Halomonas]
MDTILPLREARAMLTREESDDYCIALQPICDSDYRHVGDELLYRASASDKTAKIGDPLVATARASSLAIYEIGLQKLVGERLLFLNVSREWLERPELLPHPTEQVIIEVLESVSVSDETIKALHAIKIKGYRIALDEAFVRQQPYALLPLADIVKIDVNQPLKLERLALYRRHGCKLLAEKVEDLEHFEQALDEGFTLFQGFFFARPHNVTMARSQRRSNNNIQIRLIRELYRDMVSIDRIGDMVSQDPHLYLMIMKRANSSYYGQKGSANLKRSLQLLGLNELRTLVATIMLAQNGPICRLTMQHALICAYMCKYLAAPFRHIDEDDAFTAGLFSLMDRMLGIEMVRLLEEVSLPGEIEDALVTSGGPLGAILTLAKDYQAFESDARNQTINRQLRECYLKAVEETQALMSSLGSSD